EPVLRRDVAALARHAAGGMSEVPEIAQRLPLDAVEQGLVVELRRPPRRARARCGLGSHRSHLRQLRRDHPNPRPPPLARGYWTRTCRPATAATPAAMPSAGRTGTALAIA